MQPFRLQRGCLGSNNQSVLADQIDDLQTKYQRGMNNLILQRLMIAYVYEYVSGAKCGLAEATTRL